MDAGTPAALAAGMSQPSCVRPGVKYLITRRCYQRTFRLRPSKETNQILAYCLALALKKTGVVLHAVCFMSNHYHMVISDPHGRYPIFLQELHRFCAKALNVAHGQRENLWAAEPPSAIPIVDAHAVVDRIAYVVANPVAAGLVRTPEEWPGVLLWTEGSQLVTRPNVYFAEDGECPAELTLTVVAPESSDDDDALASWRRAIKSAVATKIAAAHAALARVGRRFLGRARVIAQSILDRPATLEPRRDRVPAIAASDPAARGIALEARRAFRVAYRAALHDWKRGVRDVVFPFGTWWMRVHHGASCAPPLAA